jgi:hypothetical protein
MKRNRAMFSHMQASAMTEIADGPNRRRASRNAVSVTADFRKVGRTNFRLKVVDLSQTGCQCETTSRVTVGDRVWITLEGFQGIEAIIRWSTPHGFGSEWAHAMHVSVFEHICKKYPAIRRSNDLRLRS